MNFIKYNEEVVMVQFLLKFGSRLLQIGLVVLVLILALQVRQGMAVPQAAVKPLVAVQVFDVNCKSLASINPTYAKLTDLGDFTVHASESMLELTFNGRIYVSSFASGSGAVFELRVDDLPSSHGRARSNLRAAEAGAGGRPVSMAGFFSGLEPGQHTASIWVRTSTGGSGTQAMVDPGCWNTDVLIVREHTPLGFTYLPVMQRQE
jgi:hypothetical protein